MGKELTVKKPEAKEPAAKKRVMTVERRGGTLNMQLLRKREPLDV
jgi:hypothetical protein